MERTWLMELLWPGAAPPQAAMSLRTSLRDLRRALGAEAGRLYSPTSRGLALELSDAVVDVLSFDQAMARGDEASLAQAVSLYRGPLLEGCAEEWCLPERRAREQTFLAGLESLAARSMERRDPAAAQGYLCRAVAVDPLRESAQRALMQALAAGGNYPAALRAYRELRLHLHRELNTEPDPETQELFCRLQTETLQRTAAVTHSRSVALPPVSQDVSPDQPACRPPLKSNLLSPQNLPVQVTPLSGSVK
jgi:DNA-binding SARP family transcriptional activator